MAKKLPFPFVIDLLSPLDPQVRPLFGAHAVYIGPKIVLILRKSESHEEANGVWIATSKEHHESLKKILPSLCSISVLTEGKGESKWQMIQLDADDFEESVTKVCDLILDGDERIGRVPKAKKTKKA